MDHGSSRGSHKCRLTISHSTPAAAAPACRTYADAGGIQHEAAGICYFVTVSPGANVLQEVTSSAGLPVAQQGTWAVTANAGTNLNTSALALETGGNLATIAGRTPALGQALAGGCVPVVLPAAQLSTLTPLSTVAVTGTFWQTTQPVSIAASVAVTGTFWQATQPVSASGNFTVVQSTAASLNATVVGTGTFAVQAAQTGTWTVELGNTANTVPILANQSDPTATTGSITAADSVVSSASGQNSQSILTGTPSANSSVSITLSAASTANIQITGTWVGTVVFERSMDGGATYVPASISLHGVSNGSLASVAANCVGRANVGGSTTFRVRCTAFTSGTITVRIQAGFGESILGVGLESSSNIAGQFPCGPQIAQVFNVTTAVTPVCVPFSTSSSGTTTVVAGVAGKKIYVLRWSVMAQGYTNVNLQSHTTTSLATGTKYLLPYGHAGGEYCEAGIVITATGEALDVNNSLAIQISGELTYAQF